MDKLKGKLPFEDFPRENLTDGITRRQLLTTLLTELHLFSKKDEGLAGVKLSNLGFLADEDLKDFIPAITHGTQISMKGNAVWAFMKGVEEPLRLFEIEPISTFTFNLINGRNTVEKIANLVEARYSIPGDRAFSIARGMFLTLVKMGVCLPVNYPSAG